MRTILIPYFDMLSAVLFGALICYLLITQKLLVPSSDAFWPTSDALRLSYIKFLTTPDSG